MIPRDEHACGELRQRTLTALYNHPPAWLTNAHRALDAAVLEAYGWPADLRDAAMLEKLLQLNIERGDQRSLEFGVIRKQRGPVPPKSKPARFALVPPREKRDPKQLSIHLTMARAKLASKKSTRRAVKAKLRKRSVSRRSS
jgi:hypothetical protein